DAIGATAAVGDEVEAELAVAAFGGDVDLTRWDLLPLDHELEVVHQTFDRAVDVLLGREHEARIVRHDRPGRQLRERLLDDAHALLDLYEPDVEAIEVVAPRSGRDDEVEAI